MALALAPLLASASSQNTALVCHMNVLTAKERASLKAALDRLIATKPKVKELHNGYELSFPAKHGVLPLATEWISSEGRCCNFFDFTLTSTHDDGPVTVRITGPDGVKQFILNDLPKLKKLIAE